MAKDKGDIISDITTYIAKFGGRYGEWYVGASTDPKQSLYTRHKVKKGDPGLLRTAHSEVQAADVVGFFVKTYKTLGEADGVVEQGKLHVYAYRRAPYTKP
ncbi:MAG: hypothetical protein H7840_01120 [Alphaproteobacteria bacterium]